MDYSVLVGGAAGQGMDTFAHLFEKTLKRCGFNVYACSDYMSRIRGGHNFFYIRFSDRKIYSFSERVHVIFAMDKETVEIHTSKLVEDGLVLTEDSISDILKRLQNPKVINTVGLGYILKYFGLPMDIAAEVVKQEFNENIVDINIKALEEGIQIDDKKYGPYLGTPAGGKSNYKELI